MLHPASRPLTRPGKPSNPPQISIPVDEAHYTNRIANAFAVIGLANSRDDHTPLLMDVRTRFAAKDSRPELPAHHRHVSI